MVTTNPFTPQDAERLRDLHHLHLDLERGSAEYVELTLLQIPAMLDLIDALREVAVAAVDWQDAGGLGGSGQAYDLHAKLRPLRSGPHAEWLKQGR